MNATRPPRARHARGFRPRLESLEQRRCPCSNNLLDDGTLLILGTDDADSVAIRDDGAGRVTVQCDGDPAATFTGVRHIVLRSGDSDDRVRYLQSNPNETPADLQFNLGDGHDALTIDWTDPSNSTPPRAEGRQVVFDVVCGAGNDRVTANFVNPPEPDFVFRTDLGGGENGYILCWQDPVHYAEPQPARHMRFDVRGGSERDDVTVMFMSPRNPDLDFRADLAGGGDRFQATFIPVEQVQPAGRFPANFNILGGNGADEIGFIIEGGRVGADTVLHVNLDGGNDADSVAAKLRNLVVDGAVYVTSVGGPGADVESVLCQNNLITGTLAVEVNGGGNVDVLSFAALDGTMPEEARLGVRLAGGNEADVLTIALGENLEVGGHAAFAASGERGDDLLRFLANDVEFYGTAAYHGTGGGGADRQLILLENSAIKWAAVLILDSAGDTGVDTLQTTVRSTEIAGQLAVHSDGGAANDHIVARIEPGPESRGRIVAELLGGSGDDELGVSVLGLSDPIDFDAVLDGGAGWDLAGVTRNVLADVLFRDVEAIFLIE